jgi:hypothetical protein
MEEMCEARRSDWLRCHCISSFLKLIQPLRRWYGGIHRQHDNRISLFFQNKESRLKTKSNTEIEKLHEKGSRSLTLSSNIVAVIKLRTRWEVYFAGTENNECIDCIVELIRHVLVEWYHHLNGEHAYYAAQNGNVVLNLLLQFCAYKGIGLPLQERQMPTEACSQSDTVLL